MNTLSRYCTYKYLILSTLDMLIIALSILFILFIAGVALTLNDAHALDAEDDYLSEIEVGKLAKSHKEYVS